MRDNQKVYIIVAVDKNNGIGIDGKLPWKLKKDMQFFKDTTSEVWEEDAKNMVVMGRKTWESIPEKYRPLADRHNVILSRNKSYKAEGAQTCFSLGEALRDAEMNEEIENVFIIGGAQIFEMALEMADGLYITKIDKEYECDTFLPKLPYRFFPEPERLGTEEENGVSYTFEFYSKDPTREEI
ncbi:dihydrofolate reductase [Candidatus Gracilibacteria bacterium]|nr:dihydrofolate reductase [Candidatus Gracilibacteria bacterium]